MAVIVVKKISRVPVSTALVKKTVQETLLYIGKPEADVSVQLCGDAAVKKLNRAYRGKDTTTDVLSFPTDMPIGEGTFDLGDLVLSIPQIIRQATQHHIDTKEECVRMLVHGTLHLAGYNHESEKDKQNMFSVQEQLVLALCT